ncbi:MAG: hypothetical protein J6Y94_05220 [Bacteriovoracaceae bacterium]|nr:hypothetical protein [Bacteriovoracaceae bacterium]
MQRAWMPVILILGLLGPFNEHGLSEKAWAAARPLGGALLPEQRGSLDFDPRLEKDYEKLIPDQAHLMGEGEDEDLPAFESKDEAAGLTNSVRERDVEEFPSGLTSREDYPLVESGSPQGPYLENSDLAFYQEYAKLGTSFLAFNYIHDNFDYSDREGAFQRMLHSKRHKKVSGAQISWGKNLHWKFLEPFWGVNLGVGYMRGTGKFKHREEESRTEFVLWVLPVEIFLGFSANLTTWLKVGGLFGPSIVGLSQNRNDFPDDHPKKRIHQIGYGHFVQGYLKLGLGRWFPGVTRNLYHSYKMTNFYLQGLIRYQGWNHFRDPITIKGLSVGLGLAFDFR